MKVLTDLLEQTLSSPLGIRVQTPDSEGLRRRIYVVLREAKDSGDLRFDSFQLSPSPHDPRGELFIFKNKREKGKGSLTNLEVEV